MKQKILKLMGKTRKWRCPDCREVFDLPVGDEEPMLCKACLKHEKSRGRKSLVFAPVQYFKGLTQALAVCLAAVVGVIVLIALLPSSSRRGGETPSQSSPEPVAAEPRITQPKPIAYKPETKNRETVPPQNVGEASPHPAVPDRPALEEPIAKAEESNPESNPPLRQSVPPPEAVLSQFAPSGAMPDPPQKQEKPSASAKGRVTWVEGYRRSDGTYVKGHWSSGSGGKSSPQSSFRPFSSSTNSGKVWVKGHFRNGKWVDGYWRNKPSR